MTSEHGAKPSGASAAIAVRAVASIKGDGRFAAAWFSPDGGSVLTLSKAGCEAWDALTGAPRGVLRPGDAGHLTEREFWRRHHQRLSAETEAEHRAREMFRGFSDVVATAPNGRLVAVGSSSGHLHAVDLDSAAPLILDGHVTSMNNHMHQNSIEAMRFDSSSTFLISMSDEEDAPLLWDLSASGEERTWNKKPARLLKPVRLREFGVVATDTVDFSPAAPRFVATDRVAETAVIWEIERRA